MADISREPLQNVISRSLSGTRAWGFVGTDALGNSILLDGLGWEKRFDYSGRTDGQPVYAGYANPETSTSQITWLLLKFTYTRIGGTDFVSRIQVATNAWDERATVGVFP